MALLVIVGAATGAIGAMLGLRLRAPRGGVFADSDRAAGVFGVLGTAFAVLLAFVIFVALESYGNAKERAGEEAVAVTQLHTTTALLPQRAGGELRDDLVCYAP